jgi:hypothetical protein
MGIEQKREGGSLSRGLFATLRRGPHCTGSATTSRAEPMCVAAKRQSLEPAQAGDRGEPPPFHYCRGG